MARYFAQLDKNNKVQRVIVADSLEWIVEHLKGTWKETFMDTLGKRYAGISFEYVEGKDTYIEEKPFPSWSLDEKDVWQPPVKQTKPYTKWDEENQKYEDMVEISEIAMEPK